jgi:TRAP-type C4-dicarboxylate transport system permease small subunit
MARVVDRIANWVLTFCALLVAAMVILIMADIVGRNLFQISITSTGEVTQLLQVYVAFLGASVAVHRALHFRIFNPEGLYPIRIRAYLPVVVRVVITVVSLVFAYYGIKLAIAQMSQLSPSLQLPYGLFYVSLPLGCLLSAFFALFGGHGLRPDRTAQQRAGKQPGGTVV